MISRQRTLEGLITPMRAQAVKLAPAPAGPEAFPRLDASYSLRYLLQHFYSVAPRPDNSIILGTSRGWQGMPAEVFQSIVNTVDDSGPHEAITQNALDSFVKIFPQGGWTSDASVEGRAKGFEYSWTGIIGMTPDAVPFIGDVPDKPGQYVAAGYNGHGMARIFLCAPALADYILSGQWDAQMPSSFRITPERIARLRKKLARNEEEEAKGSHTDAGPPLEKVTIS